MTVFNKAFSIFLIFPKKLKKKKQLPQNKTEKLKNDAETLQSNTKWCRNAKPSRDKKTKKDKTNVGNANNFM